MAIQKTQALVLKTQTFRSSSLILTFFTRDYGKLKGIAKGVRREREIRGSSFELFSELEIVFYEKLRSELHLISEYAVLESHDALRRNLDTVAYASYFSELADMLFEVHDPHPAFFEHLQIAFRFLPSVPAGKLARLFEMKLFAEIGWMPYLDGCVECGDRTLDRGFFSVEQGALLCPRCSPNFRGVRPLNTDALSLLRQYGRLSFQEALRVHVMPGTQREVENLLSAYLTYRLPGPLKSRHFLEHIRPLKVS